MVKVHVRVPYAHLLTVAPHPRNAVLHVSCGFSLDVQETDGALSILLTLNTLHLALSKLQAVSFQ